MRNKKGVKKVFKTVGLTNLEADVYIRLLGMKQAKVTKLSQKTGVTRTQLYPLMEKLVEKGFVKQIGNNPTVYSVVEPKKLISILERWIKGQNELMKNVERALKKMKK